MRTSFTAITEGPATGRAHRPFRNSRNGSADRFAENAHVIAAGDFPGLLGGEAATQHRRDEMHPARVILDAPARIELVRADADMIDADDVGHFLQPLDVFFEAREEVPDADRAAGPGD